MPGSTGANGLEIEAQPGLIDEGPSTSTGGVTPSAIGNKVAINSSNKELTWTFEVMQKIMQKTPQEIEAFLSGKNSTVNKIQSTSTTKNKPDPTKGVKGLAKGTGKPAKENICRSHSSASEVTIYK